MFYDINLMKTRRLGKVWRAGNNIFDDHSDEEVNMSNVCNKLDSWIDNDYEQAEKRLSLRASSIMVDGAARMYKRKLQQLFEDVEKLDTTIAFRKRMRLCTDNCGTTEATTDSTTNSDNPKTVNTSAKDVRDLETNVNEVRDPETNVSKNLEEDETVNSNTNSRSGTSRDISGCLYDPTDTDAESSTFTDKDILGMSIMRASKKTSSTVDKAIQVTPPSNPRRCLSSSDFDKSLPFGFVVIHDNYHSRIPSKILFSSLCEDVKRFI